LTQVAPGQHPIETFGPVGFASALRIDVV